MLPFASVTLSLIATPPFVFLVPCSDSLSGSLPDAMGFLALIRYTILFESWLQNMPFGWKLLLCHLFIFYVYAYFRRIMHFVIW